GSPTVTASAPSTTAGVQVETITSLAPGEYPWQSGENGTLFVNQNWGAFYNFGYQFTPMSSGRVTRLCGYFNGTGTVRLYDHTTLAVLSSASVTSANSWQCVPIDAVPV